MNKFIILFSTLVLFSCSKKTSLPFSYNENERQILFNVKINNSIDAVFSYDTGADGNIVDSLFFVSNNIHSNKIAEQKITGVGEGISSVKSIHDTLTYRFGNIEIKSTKNIIYDLKSISGKSDDGILGIESFRALLHKIDYQKRKITINPSLNGFKSLSIKYKNKKIYIPSYVELSNGNSVQGEFLVDTGAANSSLNSWIYNEEQFKDVKKTKFFSYRGIGNKKTGYVLKVSKLAISKDTISNHLMAISLNQSGFLAKTDVCGILGNDVLSKFSIIYDIPNLKIWYKPVKYKDKNTSLFIGFRAVDRTDINQGWIVKSLQEESDAVLKGLEINDQIISINDIKVDEIDFNTYFENVNPNETHIYEILKPSQKITKLEINFKVFFD